MSEASKGSSDQNALWNGPAGQGWVTAQDVLDALFRPFEDLLVEAVRAEGAERVLDVGCGTGSTTLAIARLVRRRGRPLGIDISEAMLTRARERAEREGSQATFLRADAQDHAFAPATFDMIVSRFGVMFFGDPAAAFSNLRRAAQLGARLNAIAWRSAAENPFMTTAERAAAPLLPDLPQRPPGGPGQFAFADPQHVSRTLAAGGWNSVDIQPLDVACKMPREDLARYVANLGLVGVALRNAPPAMRDDVIAAVLDAFAPFVEGAQVRFTAACWLLNARA